MIYYNLGGWRSIGIAVGIMVLILLLASGASAVRSDGVWIQVPNMSNSHVLGSGIITLDNGKVLVATGSGVNGLTSSSELFDPESRTWTTTGSVNQARNMLQGNARIIKMNDGRVMIAGGEGSMVSDLNSIELYNSSTGTWGYTTPLNTPRRHPAAIGLQNGKVLVTGGARGLPNNNRYLSSTEIYDPVTKQWTYSGNLNVRREGDISAVLLKNGKVLLAGGYYLDALINKAEIFDPNTGIWAVSQMPYAWSRASMTVLNNGKVLIAGGGTPSGTTAQAMLYDPDTNTWTATGSMHIARVGYAALLTDGKVLVIGGGTKSTEVYDPATGQWAIAAETSQASHNGITVLQNGDILAIGGDPDGLTAELFTDPSPTPTPTFNISGFKINNANGSGVQGWNITLMNITMQESILTSVDGSYKFMNLANGTYNVTEEMQEGWTNVSPMSQQVVIEGSNAKDINFTNQQISENQIPVILLHGLMEYKDPNKDPNAYDWAQLMKLGFIMRGSAVEIFNYEGVNQEIQVSAYQLMHKIKEVKAKYNTDKVDIVGHSEGGIVARTYINSLMYQKDVRKLVMIGSPNHGTDAKFWPEIIGFELAGTIGDIIGKLIAGWIGGTAGSQMESHSTFLNELNDNDICANMQPLVQCYTIGSHTPFQPLRLTITHEHVKIFNLDLAKPRLIADGDGLTTDNSLTLTGVQLNDADIIPNVFHSNTWPLWTDQMNSVDIVEKTVSLIRENTPSSKEYVASNIEKTPDDVATQWSPPIQDMIKPNEVKIHTVFIDNTIKEADFNLFWEGSDLDLVLYTPTGAKINSSIALNDPNINYTNESMFELYEVQLPEPGNWIMEITAVNVPDTGENYSVITFMDTNLYIAIGTNKESYVPNEPITILAYVQDNGTPLSDMNVIANISRPDGTNSTIQLYDDGLHDDNQSNDGIYANIYEDTSTSGEYFIAASVNGMIGSQSFEREAFKNVWVEQYPDLTVTSPDVNFSNDTPMAEKNITINATIHNIGDTDANNASIFFYDGDPASGVLIAEDIINVSTGQTAIASGSWNTTAGQHEIYVLISPFNEFLETNYTNNKAYKIINVTIGITTTITVNASGGADYTRIQDAINAASNGDTIVVAAGTYNENVVVNKSVSLIGVGADVTIVNASNPGEHVFNVTVNSVNISGFTMKGATASFANGVAGIYFNQVNYINISNNNVSNNYRGIYLESFSNNNTLTNNNVSSNTDGIFLASYTRNNTLTNNTAISNNYGIYLFYSSSNNTLTNNNATSNNGGILLRYATGNTLTNNKATSNGYGILLVYTSSNILTNNNATSNGDGIHLDFSNNNTLTGNNLSSNGRGIDLSSSISNTLANNIVNSNNIGIYLENYSGFLIYSSSNKIYNNIFNNTNNFEFFSMNVNAWNTTKTIGTNIIGGPYLGGNFWAYPNGTGYSQTCTDDNKNGICDSNYTMDSANVDYLPLAAIPVGYGYISGTVFNDTGIPTSIVTTNTSNSTTTDASGFYSLFVHAGNYNLIVAKEPEYYPNTSVIVTATSGTTVVQDIELLKKQTGNITGNVTS